MPDEKKPDQPGPTGSHTDAAREADRLDRIARENQPGTTPGGGRATVRAVTLMPSGPSAVTSRQRTLCPSTW